MGDMRSMERMGYGDKIKPDMGRTHAENALRTIIIRNECGQRVKGVMMDMIQGCYVHAFVRPSRTRLKELCVIFGRDKSFNQHGRWLFARLFP